jgi:hypothetical protein
LTLALVMVVISASITLIKRWTGLGTLPEHVFSSGWLVCHLLQRLIQGSISLWRCSHSFLILLRSCLASNITFQKLCFSRSSSYLSLLGRLTVVGSSKDTLRRPVSSCSLMHTNPALACQSDFNG